MERLNAYQIRDDERGTTGIITDIETGGFTAKGVAAVRDRTATIVTGEGIAEYRFSEIRAFEEHLCLMGTPIEVTPLSGVVEAMGGAWQEGVPLILRLIASAVNRGVQLPDEPSRLYLDASQHLIVLSPELQAALLYRPDPGDRRSWRERAVEMAIRLTYRVITGTAPPEAEDDLPPPVHALMPTLGFEAASLIDGVLAGTLPASAETLTELESVLTDHSRAFADTDGMDDRQSAAREAHQRRLARHRRRLHFKRNRGRYIVGALLCIGVLYAAFSLIRQALEPPPTAGLEARQVVEAYYRAWNNLDHETMTAFTERRVGRNRLREVTHLFVVARVRQAYERRVTVARPEEWLEAGEPADVMPYGLTEITIAETSRSDEEVRFSVSYRFWNNVVEDDRPRVITLDREETVVLRRMEDAWTISEFVEATAP